MASLIAGQDDEALMVRVQADDDLAFAELYDRHAPRALQVARTICRDTRRAEEAVQEGFLSIWRSRGRYEPARGSFQAWSMMMVRSRAIDSYRARSVRPPEQPDLLSGEGTEAVGASPSDEVIARSEGDALRTCLDQLPEAQAEVITLAFFGGLSHSEIATRLHLPPGTVKGRMRLGLEKLRDLVKPPG